MEADGTLGYRPSEPESLGHAVCFVAQHNRAYLLRAVHAYNTTESLGLVKPHFRRKYREFDFP
jgi:hypothetical protein